MIIEFTVENFKSIKDEQIFSLYTTDSAESHLSENMVKNPFPGDFSLLKSVGVYGANASGKSNLLKAFYALQWIAVYSKILDDGDKLPCYEPYRLSDTCKTKATTFEIEFIIPEKGRFSYKISFVKNVIVNEKLACYRTSKEAILFERKKSDTWGTIRSGNLYKGGKKQFRFFANQSYLSVAGSSPDAPELIRDVYTFFRKEIIHLSVDDECGYALSEENMTLLEQMSQLITFADTGICGIEIHKRDKNKLKMRFHPSMPLSLRKKILEQERQEFQFLHESDTGSAVSFEQKDESTGTTRLFSLSPLIFDALETGGVLIIDELDNSMHPFMAELIIKLFNDPEVNPFGAQLIFSTHNINLMSPDLMRRDQTWFAEKDKGATRIYSLDSFDKKIVTPTSPFNRWYAEGRLGAVPHIDYMSIVKLFKKGERNAKV
jgi:AAA15 family ATPase/GTPase